MTMDNVIAKWDGMKAQERDAWVAEVVFGWERCEQTGYWRKDAHSFRAEFPEYTADISAAWSAVERYFAFRVEGLANRYGYECTLWDEYSLSVTATADTASEAICLAALIAKLCPQEYE